MYQSGVIVCYIHPSLSFSFSIQMYNYVNTYIYLLNIRWPLEIAKANEFL